MIYCVVPQALADQLYDKLVEYYKDDPNVKVIIDRREGPDRRRGQETAEEEQKREIRDRRRARARGSFPPMRPSGG